MKTRRNILFLSVLTAVMLFSISAYPATLEVGSGKTYSTIQTAINVASTGDTILVYDGTYVENINFPGKAITVKAVNGPTSTMIDGNQQGSVVTFSPDGGASSMLDGFTMTNGTGTFMDDMYMEGGGIVCDTSSPFITNCIIRGNSADLGGGIFCKFGSPHLTGCIIKNNNAEVRDGGGIFSAQATPAFVNCIISNNTSAGGGGGLFSISSASAVIINCTISNNSATYGGAGIESAVRSKLKIVNSILWGDMTNGQSEEIYISDIVTSADVTYSDIQGGWSGTGNKNADPLFVGGVNYHLKSGSPCIDTGTSSGAPSTDIEGTPRPQGAGYDMGAYEYVPSTLITLSSFTATPKAGKIIVQWNTESETENAGFNLYRSDSENGNYTKINTSLIPSKGSSTQGANYEFVDTDVQNRKTYYYKLEDIDLSGTSTMHGPVNATPRLIYGIGK